MVQVTSADEGVRYVLFHAAAGADLDGFSAYIENTRAHSLFVRLPADLVAGGSLDDIVGIPAGETRLITLTADTNGFLTGTSTNARPEHRTNKFGQLDIGGGQYIRIVQPGTTYTDGDATISIGNLHDREVVVSGTASQPIRLILDIQDGVGHFADRAFLLVNNSTEDIEEYYSASGAGAGDVELTGQPPIHPGQTAYIETDANTGAGTVSIDVSVGQLRYDDLAGTPSPLEYPLQRIANFFVTDASNSRYIVVKPASFGTPAVGSHRYVSVNADEILGGIVQYTSHDAGVQSVDLLIDALNPAQIVKDGLDFYVDNLTHLNLPVVVGPNLHSGNGIQSVATVLPHTASHITLEVESDELKVTLVNVDLFDRATGAGRYVTHTELQGTAIVDGELAFVEDQWLATGAAVDQTGVYDITLLATARSGEHMVYALGRLNGDDLWRSTALASTLVGTTVIWNPGHPAGVKKSFDYWFGSGNVERDCGILFKHSFSAALNHHQLVMAYNPHGTIPTDQVPDHIIVRRIV